MRIEFAPLPKQEKPKASGMSVVLMFVFVWATMLGLEAWGPLNQPFSHLAASLAQHWRETGRETSPPATQEASGPPLRASLRSRAPNAAILGARQGY